jgi:hypothetical protein
MPRLQESSIVYDGLEFDQAELAAAMSANYQDILEFITQPAFQAMFAEMMALPPTERPAYVTSVWLEPLERESRGLVVPEGILIQVSAFGDRRPTLFVVKKFLPEKYHSAWENVNWTFNNDFKDEDVPRDPESSWRLPLSVSVQNALLSSGSDLRIVPDNSEEFSQRLDDPAIVRSERQSHPQTGASE